MERRFVVEAVFFFFFFGRSLVYQSFVWRKKEVFLRGGGFGLTVFCLVATVKEALKTPGLRLF